MKPRPVLLLTLTIVSITTFMAFLVINSLAPNLTCEKKASCCKTPKTATKPGQEVWETPVNHLIVSNN
ncbi:MAG: hypothetical protein IM584_10935 [Chitinophagaceae bacterium]|nr:hypothetical protein [Chitinophagaceae bacterium]MCA6456637.1 hypothetical protein [Chitinophagaceae bacterium]MCA6458755.1 hypothetical protein [Chitinophagaceae bacterium]MCA6464263.1 hypothetical protein [Chitinophagaceae bacterium]MEA3424769.1 hypothetical protein [Bacteroidota bacterium]